ncbi:hypothetical protein [Mesorhizobium sp.]|uniref:hypothetical protein n=1 Tax=Mesorhizobium sp. TaxID=1871066 RepID=UPI000FE4CE53|nr:hypothetical protein [Mesorhizobium sp.]RWM29424.1 MAG: hypothetical protein EOR74_07025 [Mesorhizobium sp.]
MYYSEVDCSNDLDGTNAYDDIAKFDLAEWRAYYPGEDLDDLDILDIGFWTVAGDYIAPEPDWRAELRDAHAS